MQSGQQLQQAFKWYEETVSGFLADELDMAEHHVIALRNMMEALRYPSLNESERSRLSVDRLRVVRDLLMAYINKHPAPTTPAKRLFVELARKLVLERYTYFPSVTHQQHYFLMWISRQPSHPLNKSQLSDLTRQAEVAIRRVSTSTAWDAAFYSRIHTLDGVLKDAAAAASAPSHAVVLDDDTWYKDASAVADKVMRCVSQFRRIDDDVATAKKAYNVKMDSLDREDEQCSDRLCKLDLGLLQSALDRAKRDPLALPNDRLIKVCKEALTSVAPYKSDCSGGQLKKKGTSASTTAQRKKATVTSFA
jgi:hypothetical protein